jgi:hypothetical protein
MNKEYNFMKTKNHLLLLSLATGLFSFNSFALVDYSDSSDKAPAINKSQMNLPSKESSQSLIWKSDFSLETNYELMEIGKEKVGLLNLATHLQTPFNIYFDMSYWQANTSKGSQAGNPKIILGFNWLRIGNPADQASINLYGGGKFSSNSDLGSSSTDKIFGVETTKKFGNFGLGIGYDVTLTSTPKKSFEVAVGNIGRLEVSGGWMATNDIQFEVSIENFKVAKNNDESRLNKLNQDITFSTISPKLNLQLFPNLNFELGARYPMKKAKSTQDLTALKLVDLHGMYSSSVFTGINISL